MIRAVFFFVFFTLALIAWALNAILVADAHKICSKRMIMRHSLGDTAVCAPAASG